MLNQQHPRLSIWHILLWCAIGATLLISIRQESLSADPAGYVVYAFCNGGTITVAILLLMRVAKQAKPEPGHWLAIASLLDGYALSNDVSFLGTYGFGEVPKLLFILAFIGCAIILCGWKLSWRLAILLVGSQLVATNFPITLSELFPFSSYAGRGWSNSLFRSVCTIIEFLAVLFTFLAIGVDLYRKQYRDWLHWVGILYCVMHWAYLIQAYLFPLLFPDLLNELPSNMPSDDPFGDGSTLNPFGT